MNIQLIFFKFSNGHYAKRYKTKRLVFLEITLFWAPFRDEGGAISTWPLLCDFRVVASDREVVGRILIDPKSNWVPKSPFLEKPNLIVEMRTLEQVITFKKQ